MKTLFLSIALPIALVATSPTAHEVWIEPVQWQVTQASTVQAHIRNGEYFDGFDLTWNDKQTLRSEAWAQDYMVEIVGRLGDRPALKMQADAEGLLVLLHQSDYRTVDYDDFSKFAAFLTEKGYASILTEHAKRRLPERQIKEAYARFSKSLVAVGDGEGLDAFRGLELELVALTNPYTAPRNEPMTVQLYYEGAPLSNNKVTVFERAEDGIVNQIFLQTDAEGKSSFPMNAGMTYLVDSVVLREPSRDLVVKTRGAVWESLWASLTFKVPNDQ